MSIQKTSCKTGGLLIQRLFPPAQDFYFIKEGHFCNTRSCGQNRELCPYKDYCSEENFCPNRTLHNYPACFYPSWGFVYEEALSSMQLCYAVGFYPSKGFAEKGLAIIMLILKNGYAQYTDVCTTTNSRNTSQSLDRHIPPPSPIFSSVQNHNKFLNKYMDFQL